ncbi:hypothetical protein BCR33DRAFT_563081 [Rhizoclosmatium globosum]|uniref:CUE domain-containing protein n=1 Tax=Rhizoclosmatium globosum TaxID=329046 RepID=A0A1Y2B8W9_9FUNG|nr:hypothetical protein BCR33DRAFT_563081 [Rhizoclosmatium globosum]|eukprot:ORY30937.1 hypothetical protein BCR33DRAFT_563081 [Rhizoclosmatium globosum]
MLSAKELMDAMIDFGSGSAVPLNVLEAPIIISRGGDGNPATASNPNLTTQQPLNPYPLTSAMSVPIITGGMYESVSTESLNVSSESTPPTVPLKSDYPRPPPRTVYPASSTGTFTAKPYEGHTPSITSTYSSSPSPYGPPPSLTTPQQTANLTAQPYTPTPLAFNATTTSYPSPPTLEHLAAVSADLKKTTASPLAPLLKQESCLKALYQSFHGQRAAPMLLSLCSRPNKKQRLWLLCWEVEAAAIQPTYAQEQRAAREKQRREEEEARKREEEAARLANEAATVNKKNNARERKRNKPCNNESVMNKHAQRRKNLDEEKHKKRKRDDYKKIDPNDNPILPSRNFPCPSIQSTHSHHSHHSTSTTPPITGPPPSYTHPAPQPQPRPQNPPQTQVDTLIGVSSLYVGFDAQVESLVDMFPHFPRRVLEADLRVSGSVEVTTERIVMGLVTPDSYPGYGLVVSVVVVAVAWRWRVGNRLSGGGGGGRPASVHSTNSGGGRPVSDHSTNSVGGGVYQSGLGRNGSGGSTYTQDGRTARPVSMIGTPPPPPVMNMLLIQQQGQVGILRVDTRILILWGLVELVRFISKCSQFRAAGCSDWTCTGPTWNAVCDL